MTTKRDKGSKGGRPSKYKAEFVKQAEKLCRLWATDREIADFFEVSESTLNLWKLKHPEFSEALKRTKEEMDSQVEQSLFRRAMGYSHRSEKVFQFQGQIIRAETIEHYPPDPTSMIFWLKNRQPGAWRDKPEGDGEGETPKAVQVTVEVKDARRDSQRDQATA
jgi:hypothetical protein